nr:dirigent protein 2-like [Coffea arabica]
MAKSYATVSLQILMMLLVASSAEPTIRKTEFTLYIHEYRSGPDTSIVPVAGRNGTPWGFDQFGTVFISDNLVTEGILAHSREVGRIQGIAGIVSLNGTNAEGLSSMLFTTGKYNGSTVEVKGLNQPTPVQELAIVGGTKLFRIDGFWRRETGKELVGTGTLNI